MARPKKKKADVRNNTLRIRLTDAERITLDSAASRAALDTSTWARTVLMGQAKTNSQK